MRESRRDQAVRLRTRGCGLDEIADIMGLNEDAVRSHLRNARKAGIGTKIDRSIPILEGLPDEIVGWIRRITPENATVPDTIRAIITDAYNEEQDA